MTKKPKRGRRQIFILTQEEKKAVACVLGALLLGLATKHYREIHPRPPPPPTAREHYAAQRAAKATAAQSRSARGQAARAATARSKPTPQPASEEED